MCQDEVSLRLRSLSAYDPATLQLWSMCSKVFSAAYHKQRQRKSLRDGLRRRQLAWAALFDLKEWKEERIGGIDLTRRRSMSSRGCLFFFLLSALEQRAEGRHGGNSRVSHCRGHDHSFIKLILFVMPSPLSFNPLLRRSRIAKYLTTQQPSTLLCTSLITLVIMLAQVLSSAGCCPNLETLEAKSKQCPKAGGP